MFVSGVCSLFLLICLHASRVRGTEGFRSSQPDNNQQINSKIGRLPDRRQSFQYYGHYAHGNQNYPHPSAACDEGEGEKVGILTKIVDILIRAMDYTIRKKMGYNVRRRDYSRFNPVVKRKDEIDRLNFEDYPEIDIAGAKLSTVGAASQFLLNFLEWFAFIACDIVFQLFFP